MSEVVVHLNRGLELLARSSDGDERVAARVEALLRGAGGTWRATVAPSATLDRFWVVQITRVGGDGPTQSVGYDERSPRPEAQLLRAIAEMTRGPFRTDGDEASTSSRGWLDFGS